MAHEDANGMDAAMKYLTPEERTMIESFTMQEFAPTFEEQEKLVRTSMPCLKMEIGCIEEHLRSAAEHGEECQIWADEWESVAYHLDNMMTGVKQMFTTILTTLLPGESARILAQLQAGKMTMDMGVLHEAVEVAPGVWGIRQGDMTMPDDLSSLTGGDE